MSEPPVAGQFGRYRIQGFIAAGGMGRVYCAFDTVLRRRVALKMLVDKGHEPPHRLGQLLREARAAAALSHPNAVAVYDVGETDGQPFIVMELVHGTSLRQLLATPDIGLKARLQWVGELALALDAAHRANVVHRDIKPENVMIADDGRVRLLDFGVAKHAPERSPDVVSDFEMAPASVPHRTEPGRVVGTRAYMAPEQLEGAEVDPRTDQYAWGVVAYETMSREHPFANRTATVPLLSERVPEIPFGVAAIVSKAMAFDRADRFESMADVVAALEPLVRAEWPDAAPPAPTERGPKGAPPTTMPLTTDGGRARRRVSLWISAASVALVGVGGVTVARYAAQPHGPRAPAASAASPAPTPVTLLPAPRSGDAAALAAYREGLAAARNGGGAEVAFERSVALDPNLAAAHLRLALIYADHWPDGAGQHLRRARALKDELSLRDQALLEAVETRAARSPPDAAEWAARVDALTTRFPGDAELVCLLANAKMRIDPKDALPIARRALELDPEYAEARWIEAMASAYLGDTSAAEAAARRCLETSPGATQCAEIRLDVLSNGGRCAEAEQAARQFSLSVPDVPEPYPPLANALLGQGRPLAAVSAALEREIAKLPEPKRARFQARDAAHIAVLGGDFVAAERQVLAWQALVTDLPYAIAHAVLADDLVSLYLETGRSANAADVALDFLDRRSAWSEDPLNEDEGIARDATPRMLKVALDTGRITREDYNAGRAKWIEDWHHKTPAFFHDYLWLFAYAALVDSPADATEALAALGDRAPPPFRPFAPGDARVGWTLFLGGRKDDGLRLMRAATAACRGVTFPYEETRAYFFLGEALEQSGDAAAACKAYDRVLARWGDARPRSVTADAARRHARALRCVMSARSL